MWGTASAFAASSTMVALVQKNRHNDSLRFIGTTIIDRFIFYKWSRRTNGAILSLADVIEWA
jgi:hypothetical protein